MAERQVIQIKNEKAPHIESPDQKGVKQMTLLQHLVNSDLPESELSTMRLVNEAQVLLGAGTVGTARVLDLICYHILANANVRSRVGEELREVMQDWPASKPTWTQLEKLPYFQSVIKEGLRYVSSFYRILASFIDTTQTLV
jgi:cytochrome P450